MGTVTSSDGTAIAFSRVGDGPSLILVDGALCYRASGPSGPLAAQLADTFTVYSYDRRGRGESGDTAPYAVEREVEDIDALIKEAGGSSYIYGISSGAALALSAADSTGLPIEKLALYEAPFVVDGGRPRTPDDYLPRLEALLAAERRGDAVKHFLRIVGVPAFFRAIIPLLPAWSKLKGVAHTLPYDHAVLMDHGSGRPYPAGAWSSVTVPTLVAAGGKSPEWMQNAMSSLAEVLPQATHRTIPGQTHMLRAKAIAPVLKEFFTG